MVFGRCPRINDGNDWLKNGCMDSSHLRGLTSWWLWEDVEKVVWVGAEDKQREISVRTVEELYDFLTEQHELIRSSIEF
jgi:hypothetical protein